MTRRKLQSLYSNLSHEEEVAFGWSMAQERLSEERRQKIIKKEKQLCSRANGTPAFAVERYERLCRDLPGDRDV